MREIKFRMWSGVDRSPVKPSKYFYEGEAMKCLTQQVTGFYDHEKEHGSVFEQYTGLKDKNGKEIYEGDIIECEYYSGLRTTKGIKLIWRGEVYYSSDASFHVRRTDKEGGTYSVRYGGSAIKRWEVIGNIHEQQHS